MSRLWIVLALVLFAGIVQGRNVVKREEAAAEEPAASEATETQTEAAVADVNAEATATAESTLDDKFIQEALEAHNQIRDMHGVPRLTHNPQLSQLAQAHAEFLAKHRLLINSAKIYNGQLIGENLLFLHDKNQEFSNGQQITVEWYNRYPDFDFTKDYQQEGATMSQIVWRDTREVGFGLSRTEKGDVYIVADYYPVGNVLGAYSFNVFPPKKTE